eukprot:Clim_evm84s152 gene=Clim_evmTU84s152
MSSLTRALRATMSQAFRSRGTAGPGAVALMHHLQKRNQSSMSGPRRAPLGQAVVQEQEVDDRPQSRYKNKIWVPPTIDGSKMVGMTGGEIFNEMMMHHDVDQIFGYPGGAILPVYDAIHESEHFNFVLPRHEQGGGHMAQGYARATGKPGVLVVTSGPGATNTVTPLQDALMDGTPIVVFTGQVPTAAMGSDAFQEADVVGITRPCTKWNCIVRDISELPRRINEAFYIAQSGRPGPVLVDLPKDVTASTLDELPEIQPHLPNHFLPKRTANRMGDNLDREDWQRIADLINSAKQPVIYAGQGIISGGATDLLRELAVAANIPVTTTLQGLGAFDELHPLSLHMLGMHGSAYANYSMQAADVIIALGARFDDRVTGNIQKFAPAALAAEREGRGGIIHFDIMPKNVNKVVTATEYVLGDVYDNLKHLRPLLKHQERKQWMDKINEWKTRHPFSYGPAMEKGAVQPQRVIEELARQTAHMVDKTIITTGVGQHQMWAAQYYRWRHPRTWISSGGLGTMGFGVPSAVGAKVGKPDHIVVDIDGDASFSMTAMEMATAAQYNIGAKILVLNNSFQGMVKQWQDLFYEERYSHTPMVNPDFKELAEAMNCKGIRLDKDTDVEKAVEEFLSHDGPVVMDAIVEKSEHVYPMVPAGRGLDEMVLEKPDK